MKKFVGIKDTEGWDKNGYATIIIKKDEVYTVIYNNGRHQIKNLEGEHVCYFNNTEGLFMSLAEYRDKLIDDILKED